MIDLYEKFYEIHDLHPSVSLEAVLKTMGCYEDSPVYEEIADEFADIYEEMLSKAEPVGILGFGILPPEIATKEYKAGLPVVYAVLSVGDQIKQCSTDAFKEGDYVKGMLYDAIADEALFSLEERMMEALREACGEHHKGIEKRLEAPQDIPMESQRAAWEYLELEKRFGIKISAGYMFDPVKTSCQIFILSEDENRFRAQHDCRKCPNISCKLRNIPPAEVLVRRKGEEKAILIHEKESLMEGLIREGYQFSAACGGRGHCGKCRVCVLEGETAISLEDEKVFSKEELEKGWRLSCRVYPQEKLVISFDLNDESEFEIIGEESCGTAEEAAEESCYDVAADIGTTTIVLELIGGDSGKKIHSAAAVNRQRAYGADVITRIQASVDGKKEELRACIRKNLTEGIETLVKETGIDGTKLRRIVIGGNTTMGHLLMGYDCSSLGVYPFAPVNIDFIEVSAARLLGHEKMPGEVTVLPGISAYVGGDIVSGLYALGFWKAEEVSLLIDLGTNGEMAIGNKDKILVTSAAAGPAFEGGNIAWGMGSVPGAICSITVENGRAYVKTIQDGIPEGICGTGVVETVSELVREEIVDESGLLDENWFENGFPLAETEDGKEIVFTQKDVREVQLAKAAIRAGIETLLLRYGVEKERIHKVYVAGGFGYRLDCEKAIRIGMFPKEFRNRIETVGNSSLSGTARYLTDCAGKENIRRILEISEEVALSADRDFNEFYMDFMLFDEED